MFVIIDSKKFRNRVIKAGFSPANRLKLKNIINDLGKVDILHPKQIERGKITKKTKEELLDTLASLPRSRFWYRFFSIAFKIKTTLIRKHKR